MTPTWEVRQGHVLDRLREMAAESVHCVITSPPYWGLRDYKLTPQVWGGAQGCRHRWQTRRYRLRTTDEPHADKSALTGDNYEQAPYGALSCASCASCGAWRGSLGLEPTPELYVAHLVEVLLEVFRVLRADGTLWLNLGDSYSRTGGGGRRGSSSQLGERATGGAQRRTDRNVEGVPPKSLVGIPWRVALALQAAGVPIRAEVIWEKGNPMPEAVLDRPTRAHEQLFLLVKGRRYYYDPEAIREPVLGTAHPRGTGVHRKAQLELASGTKANRRFSGAVVGLVEKRNKRSIWRVNTVPLSEAHFAAYPPELVVPCVRAGTSERGCCGDCGAPIRRRVKSQRLLDGVPAVLPAARSTSMAEPTSGSGVGHGRISSATRTVGWKASCSCKRVTTVPCTVMDPFCGSGTTGEVALSAGRSFLGLELSPDYVAMSERRLAAAAPLLARRTGAAHG